MPPHDRQASERTKHVSQLNKTLSGRYQIEREIGAGGMATVYLARDVKHDRRVALKVLNPHFAAILGTERFLAEIRVTANLKHPGILPLFDSGEAKGLLYYVMPYVDGESLRALLERERQLPVEEAVRIAVAVAGALDYAHHHGVIHRDLKPENILLEAGQPYLADFGIALALAKASGTRITQTGLTPGTPEYMSPEQALGVRDIDARSDIYALGAVTYEMLIGEPPHTGTSAQAIIARVISDKPRRLQMTRDRVPLYIDEAVDRALAKLPADRFASAGEFAAALSGRRIDTPLPMVSPRPRGKWTAAMSALVAAGIVMAFAIANWAQPGSPEAVPRFFNVTLPDSAPLVPARDPWDVATRALAISGDGRSVVYSTGQGGSVHLMLTRLDAGTTMPLPGTDSAGLPVFSPDGRSIAFRTTAQIRRVSLEDGSVTKIGDGGATGLAWSEDGHIYGRGEACLWSMPAAGGPLKRVAPNTKCLGGRMGPMQAAKLLLFDANGIMYALDTEREVIRPLRGPATAGTANGAGGSEAFGHSPFLVSPGVLAFLRNSTVYAARFDVRELRLMSEPVAVLENVRSEAYGAHLGLADDGTLVWVSGSDATRGKFVWVTRGGAIGDSLFLPREHMRSFALTSDGRRLAYNTTSPTDGNVLYVVSIDTKVIDVARTDVALDPLDWIDGDQRLLVQLHRRDATSRIAVVAWKQGNVVVDTSEAEFDGQSADGTQRCWGRRRNFLDIWKTATPTSRVQLPWGGAWCRFSPDGRRVAWIFGKSLYVASTDSAAARTRVQLAGDGADEPRWSADGKSIYFRNANRWYVVAVPSPDGKVQPPRLLFQGHFLQAYASWALGPDGRFLTLIGPEEPPARNLRVMTHFPEFVRRKLGVAD